jgi:hypothetical protein
MRSECGAVMPRRRRKPYVFDHYVFVRRADDCPTIWLWEIRCKSKPEQRGVSEGGFDSARAAEQAGKLTLAIVREAAASLVAKDSVSPAKKSKTWVKLSGAYLP